MNSKFAQGAEKVVTSRPFNLATGGLMVADLAGSLAGSGQKAVNDVPPMRIPSPPQPQA